MSVHSHAIPLAALVVEILECYEGSILVSVETWFCHAHQGMHRIQGILSVSSFAREGIQRHEHSHNCFMAHMKQTHKLMRSVFVAETELREQRRLMEAVRGILTSSVQSELGSSQQAFLQDQQSWEPPAPPSGTVIKLCNPVSFKHQP